jgi:hypothetical protein
LTAKDVEQDGPSAPRNRVTKEKGYIQWKGDESVRVSSLQNWQPTNNISFARTENLFQVTAVSCLQLTFPIVSFGVNLQVPRSQRSQKGDNGSTKRAQ